MESRERILRKADDIARKVGFRAMTLDDIAIQLSISKKTIYQYFEDKDALVDAIMDIEIENSKKDCETTAEMANDAIDEIFITMEFMTQDLNDLNPVVIHDLQKFYPDTYQKLENLKSDFFYNIISDNLKRGIKEKLYRKDINIDVLTKLRLNTMMMPFDQNIYPIKSYNIIEVNITILMHFLYGIVTESGLQLINEYNKSKTKIRNKK